MSHRDCLFRLRLCGDCTLRLSASLACGRLDEIDYRTLIIQLNKRQECPSDLDLLLLGTGEDILEVSFKKQEAMVLDLIVKELSTRIIGHYDTNRGHPFQKAWMGHSGLACRCE
jgi:hypothetical protein